MKLSKTEKNLKIAKICGWVRGPKKNFGHPQSMFYIPKNTCWHRKGQKMNWVDFPPDFISDLNAMHTAEKDTFGIVTVMWMRYRNNIEGVYCQDFGYGQSDVPTLHATAAQRAEAFVLTMDGGDL